MQKPVIALCYALTLGLSACAMSKAETKPAPLTDKQAKLLDKELTGKTAGTPVNCISDSRGDNIIRVSDDMLLYRVSGRLVYQNKLRSSCPGLAREDDIIVSERYGAQICSGDIIRLVDRTVGIQGPVCVLGEFTPYRKAPTGS
jgi:Family of unknown function (DUF6491)